MRWDGSRWTQLPGGTSVYLSEIWGSSENDIWAVGAQGSVLRWHGTVWESSIIPNLSNPEPAFLDVWGTSPLDVWVVGTLGFIVHWDGMSWSAPQMPISAPPATQSWATRTNTNVFGTSAEQVFISDAGGNGNILKLKGTEWVLDFSGGPNLYGMWAPDANSVWVVGDTQLYKRSGSRWIVDSGIQAPDVGLKGISGADPFHAIAVGYVPADNQGRFRYWNGSSWSAMPNF